MIRNLVAFALNNRFVVLSLALLLFVWGGIAFKALPVEAYPDVANVWVQVITQWPGRAAEEVEQQVTVPIEIQMNGMPHVQHVRSASLAGLSVVNLIFDDDSDNDWDREKVNERVGQVTLPPGVTATIGPDFSPIGSIYWYTLKSDNPSYGVMELKTLQDWVIAKYLKSVPDVVDDSSFGGITREYQIRLDPDKMVSYGLTLAQVEQQLTNANANAGGSFIEQGAQQINVRAVGLVRDVQDIDKTVIKTQNGTPLRIRDIATVEQGPKIRLGQIGKAIHRSDGVVLDDNDVVEGILFMRKGADTATTLEGIHAMVRRLNEEILPPGVKIVPYLDRDDLVHYAHGHAQPDRRHDPGRYHPFYFPGECTRSADRRADDSFFTFVRGDLPRSAAHFSEPFIVGRAGFRNGRRWRGRDGGKHRAPSEPAVAKLPDHADGQNPAGGARSATAGVLCDRDHHHGLSADFYVAARRREVVQADGVDGSVRAAGSADVFDVDCACAG
jgi:hypothetical protein